MKSLAQLAKNHCPSWDKEGFLILERKAVSEAEKGAELEKGWVMLARMGRADVRWQ